MKKNETKNEIACFLINWHTLCVNSCDTPWDKWVIIVLIDRPLRGLSAKKKAYSVSFWWKNEKKITCFLINWHTKCVNFSDTIGTNNEIFWQYTYQY